MAEKTDFDTKRKTSLLDLAGLLSPEEAEELKKNIKEMRRRMRREMDERFRMWANS